MSISRAEVEKVSLLARLRLSDEELDRMTVQLGDILGYIDQLSQLDTDAIEPLAHAAEVCNAFREDAVRPSLPQDEALRNAPRQDGQCYLVPAVLGEG